MSEVLGDRQEFGYPHLGGPPGGWPAEPAATPATPRRGPPEPGWLGSQPEGRSPQEGLRSPRRLSFWVNFDPPIALSSFGGGLPPSRERDGIRPTVSMSRIGKAKAEAG